MRTEEEAEMDGFKKGFDVQIDFRFLSYLVVAGLAFVIGFVLGLVA